jgi:hypothetical protein
MAHAQQFPYRQNFDNVTPPALPPGWTTTSNRSASGDFTTTGSSSLSPPNAGLSTNAAIAQKLTTPNLDFTGKTVDSLVFYERRSGTHNSGVIVEASTDGGLTFSVQLGDTLLNTGTTAYVRRAIALSHDLDNQSSVNIQWRTVGNGTGTAGTIRFDDITISVKRAFDASVTTIFFPSPFVNAGDSADIVATVKNVGLQPLSHIPVELFEDKDNDSLPEAGELFFRAFIDDILQPAETVQVFAKSTSLSGGVHRFIVRTALPTDEDSMNDIHEAVLTVGFASSAIVINEIMYEPAAGYTEYVELYNRSPSPVDIMNWGISDAPETSIISKTRIMSSRTVESGAYVVIAADSTVFAQFPYLYDSPHNVIVKHNLIGLNNSGDDIILYDPSGRTIDSLHYLPAWHNADVDDVTGRSLERINPNLSGTDQRNWSTCADLAGGTPGKANSLYTTAKPSSASISFAPNPFSPDADGFEDVTIMSYNLPSSTAIIRVRIYDSIGRLVRMLADGELAGSHGEIVWDGYDDRRQRVRMGIYIVLLEGLDRDGGDVQWTKAVVVVAVRM